jgi:hypothetical protein
MSVSIIGDLNLSQLLIVPHFKTVLNMDFTFCPASTMASFTQYRTLLPLGTRFIVVGCLAPLLATQSLTPDVELSKFRDIN